MSASDLESSIYLSDSDKQIRKKINNAFSGGQETLELHRELGGRAEVDIPFQYLKFFLEDDDELERLRAGYEKGEITTGEMKKACIKELQVYVAAFRERRKQVTEEMRNEFLRPRPLKFPGGPSGSTLKVEKEKEEEIQELEKRLAELKAGA